MAHMTKVILEDPGATRHAAGIAADSALLDMIKAYVDECVAAALRRVQEEEIDWANIKVGGTD